MKRYLFSTVALIFGLGLLVILFNYRVDPYAIYYYKNGNAESLSRIEQFLHLRITKPWHVVQKKPSAIIVGTSRSATVHPKHSIWPQNGTYNLSIPGLTSYEMLRFIQHAQANAPLSKLMIGLDFEAFIQPEPQFQFGFEESRMARDANDLASAQFIWQRVKDTRNTLLSLSAISQSVMALTGSAKVGRRYYPDGTWESTQSLFTGRRGYIYIGKESVFDQRNEKLSIDRNLDIFAEVLRFAHQHKIETRIFITPEHVFMIDLWWRLGYGESWREFHHRLVQVNDAVAIEMGVEPFPLYGFNHVRGVVDEPINTAQNSRHSLFTDGVHFRPQLGTRIMDAVWTDGAGLGAKLDADSVKSYLEQVALLHHEFESANTELTATLRRGISPELE